MIENIRSGSTLPSRMTLSDIIRNSLDRDYSLDRAGADLGALMMERESIRRRGDTEAPQLRELEHMLPMQVTFTPKASQSFKEYVLVAG